MLCFSELITQAAVSEASLHFAADGLLLVLQQVAVAAHIIHLLVGVRFLGVLVSHHEVSAVPRLLRRGSNISANTVLLSGDDRR